MENGRPPPAKSAPARQPIVVPPLFPRVVPPKAPPPPPPVEPPAKKPCPPSGPPAGWHVPKAQPPWRQHGSVAEFLPGPSMKPPVKAGPPHELPTWLQAPKTPPWRQSSANAKEDDVPCEKGAQEDEVPGEQDAQEVEKGEFDDDVQMMEEGNPYLEEMGKDGFDKATQAELETLMQVKQELQDDEGSTGLEVTNGDIGVEVTNGDIGVEVDNGNIGVEVTNGATGMEVDSTAASSTMGVAPPEVDIELTHVAMSPLCDVLTMIKQEEEAHEQYMQTTQARRHPALDLAKPKPPSYHASKKARLG